MPHFLAGRRTNASVHLLSPETARTCPSCGTYTHRWEDLGDMTTPMNQDWSLTHEGFNIVSQKFKDIVEDTGVREVDFLPLSNGCFVFRPQRVVFLDVTEALERTKGPCLMCGRLTAFLGIPYEATIMSGQQKVGMTDIVRTAQAFGGDNFRSEEYIFGEEVLEALNYEGLRGGIFWYECRQDS
jgi:hypothetical protein